MTVTSIAIQRACWRLTFLLASIFVLPSVALSQGAQEDLTPCKQGLAEMDRTAWRRAIDLLEACRATGNLSVAIRSIAHRNVGLAYSQLGDQQKAIAEYDQGLALTPRDSVLLINRGNSYSELGQLDKALEQYDIAQKIDPAQGQIYYNRGIVFEKQKRLDDAKEQFLLAYKQDMRTAQLLERIATHNLVDRLPGKEGPQEPLPSRDYVRGALYEAGHLYNGKWACFGQDTVESVLHKVEQELTRKGLVGLPTQTQAIHTMFSIYPCPTSPYRQEVRAAQAADVEGAWIFPQKSQRLRYPPRSGEWGSQPVLPQVACDAVGYFEGNEARHIEWRNRNQQCPFERAEHLNVARGNPKVTFWTVPEAGRLVISRTDFPDLIQEWEVFVVASPFEAAGVHFKEGDLLQYLRKERGRDFIAALQFRHLRKLPGAEGTPRPISKEENAAAVKWMAERVIEVKGSKETP